MVAGLLHVMAFLELSGNGAVDPDWALEAMEHVVHYLQRLSPEACESLSQQLDRVAAHARQERWGEAAVQFFSRFMNACVFLRGD